MLANNYLYAFVFLMYFPLGLMGFCRTPDNSRNGHIRIQTDFGKFLKTATYKSGQNGLFFQEGHIQIRTGWLVLKNFSAIGPNLERAWSKFWTKINWYYPNSNFFGVRSYKIQTIFQLAVRTKISNLYVAFSGIVRGPAFACSVNPFYLHCDKRWSSQRG